MYKIKFKSLRELIIKKNKIRKFYAVAINKYHKIFRLPLTGLMWEQVCENILLKFGFSIVTPVSVSHRRGKDIQVDNCNWVSCKTAKINYKVKKKVKACSISSYRLSSVDNILESIQNFEKTFDYYIISMYYVRNGNYVYELYIFPTKCLIDCNFFSFSINKSNIHKDLQLRVVKSLSSQLWIDVLDLIRYKPFLMVKVEVNIPLNINFI